MMLNGGLRMRENHGKEAEFGMKGIAMAEQGRCDPGNGFRLTRITPEPFGRSALPTIQPAER